VIQFAPAESILAMTGGVAMNCILMAMVVGLFAAIYPAWQASRLQPATALKVE
jgi:ABC-type lipoprotein release transport system permease subunit